MTSAFNDAIKLEMCQPTIMNEKSSQGNRSSSAVSRPRLRSAPWQLLLYAEVRTGKATLKGKYHCMTASHAALLQNHGGLLESSRGKSWEGFRLARSEMGCRA